MHSALKVAVSLISTAVYVFGLDGITLEIVPAVAHRGGSVAMLCHYTLGGSPLYYIKWYRGNFEFYRYTPSESPPHKIFPYPGIHVDVERSNGTQVVLQDINLGLSGKVTCEVTTDSPIPETTSLSAVLTILDLPETGPVILADRQSGELEPGDTLRANCTTPPSKPAPNLSFTINGQQCWEVAVCERKVVPLSDTVHWSATYLTMHLKPSHFKNGVLNLKCTALIPGFFHEESEINLKGSQIYQTIMVGSLGTRRQMSSAVRTLPVMPSFFICLNLLYTLTSIR